MAIPKELALLEKAAADVLEQAKATLSGVGLACFCTAGEQEYALAMAQAKVDDAAAIVEMVDTYMMKFGEFN